MFRRRSVIVLAALGVAVGGEHLAGGIEPARPGPVVDVVCVGGARLTTTVVGDVRDTLLEPAHADCAP